MSLNKMTIQRLASDVKYLLNNSLENENIFYKHSEEDILKGYALIIGHNSTPYEFGYFFFEFIFPSNYPFNPPIVNYLTNDGKMRFNPNLYANGKVCLSILNTWNGEGWTSSQTIYSILITLSSILNDKPLLNEPGINNNNKNIIPYNLLIKYKTIEVSIINQIKLINICKSSKSSKKNETNNKNDNYINILILFEDIIYKYFKKNKDLIYKNIDNIEKELNSYNNNIYIQVYNLNYKLDTNYLRNNLNKIKIE